MCLDKAIDDVHAIKQISYSVEFLRDAQDLQIPEELYDSAQATADLIHNYLTELRTNRQFDKPLHTAVMTSVVGFLKEADDLRFSHIGQSLAEPLTSQPRSILTSEVIEPLQVERVIQINPVA